jgi:hypothetical protein
MTSCEPHGSPALPNFRMGSRSWSIGTIVAASGPVMGRYTCLASPMSLIHVYVYHNTKKYSGCQPNVSY